MKHLVDYQTLYRWDADLYSYTFPLKLAGARFGRRMIICRSSEAELLLISPLPIPFELGAKLGEMGRITTVVFPTAFHDTRLKEMGPLLETVSVFAVSNLFNKLPQSRPIDQLPAPWSERLRWQRLGGMPKVNETVFYHPQSRSLMPSDLLFKFSPSFAFWTRSLAKMMGSYPQLRPTRLFKSLIKDKAAFDRSLHAMLQWDFDCILPSHAEIIDGPEGRSALESFLGR